MKYNLEKIKESINPNFYPLMNDHQRYLILRGGGGSGKSYFLAQKILLRILFAQRKGVTHKFLCLRKTLPDVRRSVFSLLKFYILRWEMDKIARINKTDMTIYFENGSEIICTGLDEPEKIKSIHGITGVWLEEATEFSNEDFRQVDLRIRGIFNDYYQIMLSFNPISKNNWIYNEFFENIKPNATLHHSTYRDNNFLDDDYIELLKGYDTISNYHHQVYTLGEWGVLSGLIYENWALIEEMPKGVPLYGLDFGFNAPTALVEIKKRKEGIYVKEILYKSGLTNLQLINVIKKKLKPSSIIVCDSAEPARIKEMQNMGIKAVGARKGANSIFDGIDFVKRQNLFIVKPSVNLVNEISGYQWKTNKAGEPLDAPVEINDHIMDAIRYPLWTKWGHGEAKLEIVWL